MFLLLHWRIATKSTRIWHDYSWPWVALTWLLNNLQLWRHGRWFRKFSVRFRPIRKELVSSMYNKFNYCLYFFHVGYYKEKIFHKMFCLSHNNRIWFKSCDTNVCTFYVISSNRKLTPGARFSKLLVITGPVKLCCFPFQMGVSKLLKIVQ